MPLPLLFIGAAVATGTFGAGKTAVALSDNMKANKINTSANEAVDTARQNLERQREQVSFALQKLGVEKLFVLQNTVRSFLDTFETIKNVDFRESTGLEELQNLNIDQADFEDLKELGNFALNIAGGATAGAAGGAMTAIGAWGAAQSLACASTGTAISSLSGIAAHNATLAFFGGGSLASGGLGMAGGTIVLGGIVAGPALLVMGLITGAKAQEKVEKALENKAQADEIVEALNTAAMQCSAIRRRTSMFYTLLAHLDSYFLPQIWNMEDVVREEGTDYRMYKPESKKKIAIVASTAKSIKAVLDTPILTEEGNLTEESEEVGEKMRMLLYK